MIQYSVDRTVDAYVVLYNMMYSERVKSGRNIFLKNNLDSLIAVKKNGVEKIDHSIGTTENIYNGN